MARGGAAFGAALTGLFEGISKGLNVKAAQDQIKNVFEQQKKTQDEQQKLARDKFEADEKARTLKLKREQALQSALLPFAAGQLRADVEETPEGFALLPQGPPGMKEDVLDIFGPVIGQELIERRPPILEAPTRQELGAGALGALGLQQQGRKLELLEAGETRKIGTALGDVTQQAVVNERADKRLELETKRVAIAEAKLGQVPLNILSKADKAWNDYYETREKQGKILANFSSSGFKGLSHGHQVWYGSLERQAATQKVAAERLENEAETFKLPKTVGKAAITPEQKAELRSDLIRMRAQWRGEGRSISEMNELAKEFLESQGLGIEDLK